MAIDVGQRDFERSVLQASRESPVVVDFWASWCRPCLVLGPVLERLEEEYGGRFVLARVDVDANPALASSFGVQGIPAVKGFRGGRVVSEFVGAQPEEAVRRFLDEVLPSEADGLAARGEEAERSGVPAEAEAAYRAALEREPAHEVAAAGLARLLAEEGKTEEARALLARIPATEEVRRIRARLELQDRAALGSAGLGDAAALAAAGDHRAALDRALQALAANGDREAARELMVHIFEVLGHDHPLVREYRPRLARALF